MLLSCFHARCWNDPDRTFFGFEINLVPCCTSDFTRPSKRQRQELQSRGRHALPLIECVPP